MYAMQEHDMPPGRPHTGHTGRSGHSYERGESWDWMLVQLRHQYRTMPPAAREAMLDRMVALLHDEIRRKQAQPSALMCMVLKVKK
jgi:hypothetical protein